MRKGDKVRWAESHCRLESLKAHMPDRREWIFDQLRKQVGHVMGGKRFHGSEILEVLWCSRDNPESTWMDRHYLPAELLERAEP